MCSALCLSQNLSPKFSTLFFTRPHFDELIQAVNHTAALSQAFLIPVLISALDLFLVICIAIKFSFVIHLHGQYCCIIHQLFVFINFLFSAVFTANIGLVNVISFKILSLTISTCFICFFLQCVCDSSKFPITSYHTQSANVNMIVLILPLLIILTGAGT